MGRQPALTLAAALVAACTPPSFGETLLVVDTDVDVPRLVDRLRVDVYGEDGAWLDSRQFLADRREAWPLSFGLAGPADGVRVARVRLRAFLSGRTRDYRGERGPPPPFAPPPIASSLAELCASAPLLPAGAEYTARRGATPLLHHVNQGDCNHTDEAGSIAVRVEIPDADTYRFEVVRAFPDGSLSQPNGDTVLFLRSDCAAPTTQVACNDNINLAGADYLSRLVVDLTPGTYYLMTSGGTVLSPADLTLRWQRASAWDPTPMPPPAPPPPATPMPRLIVDGADLTPLDEPQPGVTIERVVDVEVRGGTQRTAPLLLSGECFGTVADLAAGTSCVDRAGERRAVARADSVDGVALGGPSLAGSWARLQPAPCPTPRADSGVHDDEVCVPGGVFVFGDASLLMPKGEAAFPEQVAAVDTFLMDRYEVTVARYRQAMAQGFNGIDPISPIGDDRPLYSTPTAFCTFNGDAAGPAPGIDREAHALNCISWYQARAFCQHYGGDLPREVEWEYAAGGGAVEAAYPWGDDAPACANARYLAVGREACVSGVPGPRPVDAAPWVSAGRSALGLVGLAGNVAEWTRDSARALDDTCFAQQPLTGVGCDEPEAPEHVTRGGSWASAAVDLRTSARIFRPPGPISIVGFRCVRRVTP